MKGLNPGAPVRFRGVTVGKVAEMLILHNQAAGDPDMPVIIEVDESVFRKKTDQTINLAASDDLDKWIKQGLRGILEAQSLVTGVLYVELDILPHAPPPKFHQLRKEYKEIPTVPTRIEAFIDNLAQVDFKQLAGQISSLLTRLDSSLGELNVADINRGITNLLFSINQVVASPDLTNSLVSVHQTLDEYRRLSEEVRARVGPLASGADVTMKEAQTTLIELRKGLQNAQDLIAPQAPLRRDVSLTLDALAEAAHSIGALADFLNRNPNALLSGRKPPEHRP